MQLYAYAYVPVCDQPSAKSAFLRPSFGGSDSQMPVYGMGFQLRQLWLSGRVALIQFQVREGATDNSMFL